jgi:hypothetical protein
MENYMTSIGISASSVGIPVSFVGISVSPAGISTRQSLHVDILVLVQEPLFMDSRRKEINGLLKKGVFVVIAERDVL